MRRFSCLLVLLLADSLHSFQSPVVVPRRAPKSSSTQLHSIDEIFRNIDPTLGASLAFVGVAGTAFLNRFITRRQDTKNDVLLLEDDEEEPTTIPETMEKERVFNKAVMGAVLEMEQELAKEDQALRATETIKEKQMGVKEDIVLEEEPCLPKKTEEEALLNEAVVMYTDTFLVGTAAPTVESPTRHFSKGFADSTPYSQAGPPQKGRSDVSHLDQMEDDDTGDDAYTMDAIGSTAISPTGVESPTRHFSKGFADSTPYSQAGPPQKGRSDVSHLDQMEDDSGYLDAHKTPFGRDRFDATQPLVESEEKGKEAFNFEVQKDVVDANVEEPPVETKEKSEKSYTLQVQNDPVDTINEEPLVEGEEKVDETFNLEATTDLVEAAIEETVMESDEKSEEAHNLKVQKDPVKATTVIEELPVESEEKIDKPSSIFQSKSPNDEEVEASPKKKKPSAAVSYLDSLAKPLAEATVDSSELLSSAETMQVTVHDACKEPEPSTPVMEPPKEPSFVDFLKSSKDSSEDVAATAEEAPVEVAATPQISVMDLKNEGMTDAPLIEEPPVKSAEKTKEPSLFSYLKSSKEGSYEDVVAIAQEPPAEAAATQKVLNQALKDDGIMDTLHEYIQDLAREETRKRMDQKKRQLASRMEPKVVDETPSAENTRSETTTPSTKKKSLPEFLANNGFDETEIMSYEKESETEIESAEKVKIVVEKVKTPKKVKSMAKPIKEKQLGRLVRSVSENKGPILLVALAFVVSKRLLATLIGRGML
jgi:hypothetical protein